MTFSAGVVENAQVMISGLSILILALSFAARTFSNDSSAFFFYSFTDNLSNFMASSKALYIKL
jgi:hypothetical protein